MLDHIKWGADFMTTCLTTFRTGLPGDSSMWWTLYQFFRTKKHVLDAISRKKLYLVAWGGRGRTFKSCHSDQIKPKTNRFRLYFLHFRGKIERFLTTFTPPEIPKLFDHMFDHSWSKGKSFGCFCSGTLCSKN